MKELTATDKKFIAMEYFKEQVGLEKEKLKEYAPQLADVGMLWWMEETGKKPEDMNPQDVMDLMVMCVVTGASYINQINEATVVSQDDKLDKQL